MEEKYLNANKVKEFKYSTSSKSTKINSKLTKSLNKEYTTLETESIKLRKNSYISTKSTLS